MKDILDAEDEDHKEAHQFEAGNKPIYYLATMFIGSLLYGRYCTVARFYDAIDLVVQLLIASVGLIISALIISLIFEGIGFLVRQISNKKKNRPLWFTTIEGAFYTWIVFMFFALIGFFT